jgi:hypothetical protein
MRPIGLLVRRILPGAIGPGVLALGIAACSSPSAQTAPPPMPTLPQPPASDLTLPLAPPTNLQLSSALEAIAKTGPPKTWNQQRQGLFRGYLATLAARGPASRPELFPSPPYVLAYLVNAHVAWTIALADAPELAKLNLSAVRELPITVDGTTTSLRGLTDEIARRAPFEPRLGLFLNPGWRGVPPLPETALAGHTFDWQLADHAKLAGRTPGFWELDPVRKVLKVSSFTNLMWGLPNAGRARIRKVFELVPPPEKLRWDILAYCGISLSGCSVSFLPINEARLWDARPTP